MHMVILALVCATDESEALDRAEEVFNKLVEDEVFDYYTMFRPADTSTVGGRARWGPIPAVIPALSDAGQKLIEEGMKATRDQFLANLLRLRTELARHSDDELCDPTDPLSMFDYYARCVGEREGPNTWVYDQDGCGIHGTKQLQQTFKNYREQIEAATLKIAVWVVPVDVHS